MNITPTPTKLVIEPETIVKKANIMTVDTLQLNSSLPKLRLFEVSERVLFRS